MTEENNLKKQLERLQLELNKKDREISEYLDKIEYLEDEIMKLDELITDKKSKKQSKKVKQSKLEIELEAKEKEIRDLKDRMGFLRKEKIDAQKELEKIKSAESSSSSVMRVEDLRDKQPLSILVKELQDKINKQESLIKKLKRTGKAEVDDYSDVIEEKDKEIESLKEEISILNKKLEEVPSINESKSSENVKKVLLEDLQETLTKVKRQNEDLKKKIEKYEKASSSGKKGVAIASLTQELDSKNKQIKELNELIATLKQSKQSQPLDQVVEELQNKLNKAKTRIQLLESQSNGPQIQNLSDSTTTPGNINEKLKIQREMAGFLQQKLDEAQRNLSIKDEEIATIKNEAIRIKKSYEILENQLKQKDQFIFDLKNELSGLKAKSLTPNGSISEENPDTILRIEELKSMLEDLKKQNIQQRLEISQLRKST
jgi:chromosome segregation protein